MTESSRPEGAPEWTPKAIAAERKRIVRQTWIILGLIAVVLFGVTGPRYERVQGASGRTYRVVDAGRRMGPDWSGSYVRYLSSANDQAGLDAEFADLSHAFSEFTGRNDDARLEVVAVRRRFAFGQFHVDQTVTLRYRRDAGGSWRRE